MRGNDLFLFTDYGFLLDSGIDKAQQWRAYPPRNADGIFRGFPRPLSRRTSPLLPEFPEFPGHTEGPEEGKPVHPRPVTPARPAKPNNGEEMPSPRRPHGRRPDSYQPEKGRDRGGRTSDDRSRTIRMKTNVREQRTSRRNGFQRTKIPSQKREFGLCSRRK